MTPLNQIPPDTYYVVKSQNFPIQVARNFIFDNKRVIWMIPGSASRGGLVYWSQDRQPLKNLNIHQHIQIKKEEVIEDNQSIPVEFSVVDNEGNILFEAQILTKSLYDKFLKGTSEEDITNIEFKSDEEVQEHFLKIENNPWSY